MGRMTRKRIISVALQQVHLNGVVRPERTSITRNHLIWEARLLPSPLSRTYLIRIEYDPNVLPNVHVLDPDLAAENPGKKLPHVFIGNRLCLCRRTFGDWNGDMYLADTILPWISEWLLFYEIWMATGEWKGGGDHPKEGDKDYPK